MESKEQMTTGRKSMSAAEEPVTRYKANGKTPVAYCEEYGIKKATFAYWLKRQRDARSAEPGGFVRISSPARDHAVAICYTNVMHEQISKSSLDTIKKASRLSSRGFII